MSWQKRWARLEKQQAPMYRARSYRIRTRDIDEISTHTTCATHASVAQAADASSQKPVYDDDNDAKDGRNTDAFSGGGSGNSKISISSNSTINTSDQVSIEYYRAHLASWMFDVVVRLALDYETYFSAIDLLDRYVWTRDDCDNDLDKKSSNRGRNNRKVSEDDDDDDDDDQKGGNDIHESRKTLKKRELHTTGIACLWMCANVHHNHAPHLGDYLRMLDAKRVKQKDIERVALHVIKTVDGRICTVATMFSFLNLLLCDIGGNATEKEKEEEDDAMTITKARRKKGQDAFALTSAMRAMAFAECATLFDDITTLFTSSTIAKACFLLANAEVAPETETEEEESKRTEIDDKDGENDDKDGENDDKDRKNDVKEGENDDKDGENENDDKNGENDVKDGENDDKDGENDDKHDENDDKDGENDVKNDQDADSAKDACGETRKNVQYNEDDHACAWKLRFLIEKHISASFMSGFIARNAWIESFFRSTILDYVPAILGGDAQRLGNLKPAETRKISVAKKQFCDAYDVQQEIGSGQYGGVSACASKSIIGLRVAVKNYRDSVFTTSVLREIGLLASMRHRNVAYALETFIDDCRVHIVMPLRGGGDLYQYLYEERGIRVVTRRSARRIARDICSGLAYMHRNRIVHRDLKPANIVLDEQHSKAMLIDFSLARCAFTDCVVAENDDAREKDNRKDAGNVCDHDDTTNIRSQESRDDWRKQRFEYSRNVCTVPYRCPELLLGAETYDPFALDVWSLGCIVAEIALSERFILCNDVSTVSHLFAMFQALGTPDDDRCPGIRSLPYWNDEFPRFRFRQYDDARWKHIETALGNAGFDLLLKMLRYDARRRITAEIALKHAFFSRSKQKSDDKDEGDNVIISAYAQEEEK